MAVSVDQFRLDGKVAIVTGVGGRGNSIGRAYALGLAQAGASGVVADINSEGARAVKDEVGAVGGRAIGVDITQPDSVRAMTAAAREAFGGVDILVNNAALMAEGQPDELVGTLLLLCSSAGGWIPGQVLHVDGGWVMRP